MYLTGETLDDLMRKVYERLLKCSPDVSPTRGQTRETVGVLLRLKNPRARLSRTETKGKPFSALGELLWYLSKSNSLKFISYYLKQYAKESEDQRTVYGAYGPRLFKMRRKHDQVENVLDLLRKRPSSRRATIQLFDAEDLASEHIEIPCTCTLQFMIRRKKLHMFTSMRSNDAFFGLPHDVFAFTMIQEILARSLSVEVGTYSHAVGSLHIYEKKTPEVEAYLNEGWQPTTQVMPPMPEGDPWPAIQKVLKAESSIRLAKSVPRTLKDLPPYWADLVRLLQVHSYFKTRNRRGIERVKSQMSSQVFVTYIDQKLTTLKRRKHA